MDSRLGPSPPQAGRGDLKDEESSSEDALADFNRHAKTLQKSLQDANSEADVRSLKPALDEARNKAIEGVEWWVGYDVRQANDTVRNLEEAFDAATQRVRPRRKFQFRRAVAAEATGAAEQRVAPVTSVTGGIVFGASHVRNGVLEPQDVAGMDVTVQNVSDARITLGEVGALRVVGLAGCRIETGHVSGSIYVTGCTGCTFRAECQQLRIHGTVDCDFVVRVRSGPIIEGCSAVRFGCLGEENGNFWREVRDFSWLREGKSPNWEVIA